LLRLRSRPRVEFLQSVHVDQAIAVPADFHAREVSEPRSQPTDRRLGLLRFSDGVADREKAGDALQRFPADELKEGGALGAQGLSIGFQREPQSPAGDHRQELRIGLGQRASFAQRGFHRLER